MDQMQEPVTVLFDGARGSILLEVNNAPGEYDPRRTNSVEITVEQAYGLIGQLRAAVSLDRGQGGTPPMQSLYECRNTDCNEFGVRLAVKARELGPFYEWPNLRCACGMEPMIVKSDEPISR